jgi:hypothetical protein
MGKGRWLGWLGRSRSSSRLLDLQEFRERVVAAITKSSPTAEVDQFDDDGIWVTLPGKPDFSIHVARFHGVYCDNPRDLERLVDQLASVPGRGPRSATADKLRILVRPDTYLIDKDKPEQQITKHIAGELWAMVGMDEGDAIGFPEGKALREDLAMDDPAIWKRALANTRGDFPRLHVPASKSIQFFAAEQGYASSCLADDELWTRLDQQARDGVIVIPLETNVVCIVGSFSAEAMPALAEACAISEASPDHLSSVPLTRRDGAWVQASEVDPAFARRNFKH